jgi:subtilase family serine protease
MGRRWLVVVVVLASLGAATLPAVAVAGPVAPQPVGSAPVPPDGSIPSTAPLPASIDASVVLRPADPVGLQAYATQVSTPGTPEYRQFLTPSEVAARFGPSPSTVAEVRAWLAGGGLTLRPTVGDGTVVPFTGTATAVSAAFGTVLGSERLPSGRIAYANRSAPLVPAGLAPQVQEVVGLDDLVLPEEDVPSPAVARTTTTRRVAVATAATAGPTPCAAATAAIPYLGTTVGGVTGYPATADQVAPAFGLPPLYAEGDLGQGTTAAVILIGSDYLDSDIRTFEQCYGIDAPVSRVPVDGGPQVPPGGGGDVELTMDIDAILSLAPRTRVLVYEAPFNGSGLLDAYAAMAQDDRADVGTVSAGTCEPLNNGTLGEDTVFEEMAAQGQTMFASSGDQGSEGCLNQADASPTVLSDAGLTALSVNDPASQPFVIGVGGVYLPELSDPSTATVWNNGPFTSWQGNHVSSGGYSTAAGLSGWAMSPWQVGTGTGNSPDDPNNPDDCGLSGASACRAVPDVAADADSRNNLLYYCLACGSPAPQAPGWWPSGGTSVASPEWAAVGALIDAGVPGGRAGFLAPALYRAAAADPSAFVDVTQGDTNYLDCSNTYGYGPLNCAPNTGFPQNPAYTCTYGGVPDQSCYQATPGYDVASGLGLPDGAALAADVRSFAPGGTFFGSMGGIPLTAPVVGLASTPAGRGYWEVASDGGIFAFGNAGFLGSMGGKVLDRPIVGIAATPDGGGYWEVASDGGVFSFGDAGFLGSMGGKVLNRPIVGIAATPDGGGYWEVASDGGVFSFGDAGFLGSMGGHPLARPVVGMASNPDRTGYWEVASDGGLFAFPGPSA